MAIALFCDCRVAYKNSAFAIPMNAAIHANDSPSFTWPQYEYCIVPYKDSIIKTIAVVAIIHLYTDLGVIFFDITFFPFVYYLYNPIMNNPPPALLRAGGGGLFTIRIRRRESKHYSRQ